MTDGIAPRFEEETAPLQVTGRGEVQVGVPRGHPLRSALGPGETLRFLPVLGDADIDDGSATLGFRIECVAEVESDREVPPPTRNLRYIPGSDQYLVAWPRALARGVGLSAHGTDEEVQVRLSDLDDGAFEASFTPPLELPAAERFPRSSPNTDETRRLQPLPTRDPGDRPGPEKYRLRFPVAYNDRYGFEAGTDVAMSVEMHEGRPAIVFRPDADDARDAHLLRRLQVERRQREADGNTDTDGDDGPGEFSPVHAVYVPKSLVHFLGLAGERVTLLPRDSTIVASP